MADGLSPGGVNHLGPRGGEVLAVITTVAEVTRNKLPLGWSFKVGKRLKGFDRKGRQRLPSGWSFKISKRLKRFDWRKASTFFRMKVQDQQEA